MGLLDKLKFHAWDNTGAVADLIGKWSPSACKTEKDYEKSLYLFLDEQLGDVQITKQYAKGRMRADIVVGDKVILELKHKLDSTAKLHRLIGQLETYAAWEGTVIVLLTGETDANLRKELQKKLKELCVRDTDMLSPFVSSRFRLVEK